MLLLDEDAVHDVLGWAEVEAPGVYEPVGVRTAGSGAAPPDGLLRAGLEPSYLPKGYFSPACDCMCFPRWHGTDPEGILFVEHFAKLNPFGLFDSAEDATSFSTYYEGFDWTERGPYSVAEVFLRAT